jgi:hypothetical protein
VHRPFASTPVPVLPGCPGLPDRDIDSNAPPPPVARTKLQWRSTCTGQRTKRRTRRLPRRERAFYAFSSSVHALRRVHADERSLPRLPLDIRCRRCGAERGGVPFPTSTEPNLGSRSDDDPRRSSSSCKPGCLPPLRTVWPSDERFLPRPTPPVGPSLTPPTRFPLVGERCLHGPCKRHAAVTRVAWHSRDKRLFYQRDDLSICRAWD